MTINGTDDRTDGCEIEDVVVMTWREASPQDFSDQVLDLDILQPTATEVGDNLAAFGLVKDLTTLDGNKGTAIYNFVEVSDDGPSEVEHLRRGRGAMPETPTSITGFSGGMVWNRTQNTVAGVTLRGGITDHGVVLHYLPFTVIYAMVEKLDTGLRAKDLIGSVWPSSISWNLSLVHNSTHTAPSAETA